MPDTGKKWRVRYRELVGVRDGGSREERRVETFEAPAYAVRAGEYGVEIRQDVPPATSADSATYTRRLIPWARVDMLQEEGEASRF